MGTGSLKAAFDRSLKDPAGFWSEAAEAVSWYKKWSKCSTTVTARFTAGSQAAR